MAITNKTKWNVPESGNVYNQTDNKYPNSDLYKNIYNIVDDKLIEVRQIVVHQFMVSDVDDPILYAGEPLYNWQQSEAGQWVMKHAVEAPMWKQALDPTTYCHTFVILARLKAKDITYFHLKWGNSLDTRKRF